ncbi:MAG: LCP family protein, partial [Rubrobacteraceae bacterium]
MRRRIARSLLVRRVSAILAGLVVAVVGIFFAWDVGVPILEQNWNLASNASTFPEVKSEENGPPKVANAEAFNVLVMGVDKRPARERTEETGGSRSDTLILTRVYPESGDIRMVSIPRDLLVRLSPEREGKINAAYSEGGRDLVVDVVENYTKTTVDHTVVVNFRGFKRIIDSMGGLRMEVEEGLPGNFGLQSGTQTLNGPQALFYARYRGTEGGDLDR